MSDVDFTIDELSKIEGKARLDVRISGDAVDVAFGITEYKRFYTEALKGKDALAIPQLTARICGTCSNAHMLCAIKTIEKALGVTVSEQTKKLRELLNWGLFVRDHALHLYVFVMPDVLGLDSILDVDMGDPVGHQILEDTFAIKAAGNNLAKLVGGRSVHAPFPMVGGFLKLPDQSAVAPVMEELKSIRPRVIRCIEMFRTRDMSFIHDAEYAAMIDERLSMSGGSMFDSDGEIEDELTFVSRLNLRKIGYSHAAGYTYKGKAHMVGALARLNLGKSRLHPNTKRDIGSAMDEFPSRNVFHNNLAQAIEILHAVDSAIEILSDLRIVEERPVPAGKKAACAVGATEAPRGTLVYKLGFDELGKATDVAIIVPTGQNQIGIEEVIRKYVTEHRDEPKEKLIPVCERIIRAYDPCMSCASHFLKVRWQDKSGMVMI